MEHAPAFLKRCDEAACRSCGGAGLRPVLDLGSMPLADGLVPPERHGQDEARYPLEVAFCPGCSLVQIIETVAPEVLFGHDYPYFSSFSDALLRHSRANALELIETRGLGRQSLVVEVASNDGYLLKNFVENGVPVLGIDPAPGPAQAAEKAGVPTMRTFFGQPLAQRLRAEGRAADVIIANNVLAHVADTNGLVEGFRTLLKDDGVLVVEVPYVRDLIDHCEFDTIYHEHLCYFSVTALDALFRRHALYLNDVRRLPIHGGSLRLYVEPRENVGGAVCGLLDEERALGVDRYGYYERFGERVRELRDRLVAIVRDVQSQGKRLAAYGAAAKGAVMLNFAGLDHTSIEYVVDRNVHKQGRYMPGVGLRIDDPSRLMQDRPDYVIILPWNFKDEIMTQQQAYRDAGGRFIVPIPEPAVV